MITPMKKATLLCLAADREKAVAALRDLGIVHVVTGGSPKSGAQSPESSADALAERDRALRVQRLLAEVDCDPKAAPSPQPPTPNPQSLVSRALALDASREAAEKRLAELRAEEAAQAPLGDFDPGQARALVAKGIPLSLYRVPVKETDTPASWTFLGGSATHRYYASLEHPQPPAAAAPSRGPDSQTYAPLEGGGAERRGVFAAEPVPLPARSLSAVRADIAAAKESLAAARRDLAALAPQADSLPAYLDELSRTVEFRKVGESLADHGAVVSLDGFLPAARVSELRAAARVAGWALWIREPDPGEKVPVSLSLPRWLRPISVLFEGLGILPGYREVDVSAVFLVFFSFFFAMIVGDAGYGALLLLAVLGLRMKFRKASAKPFWLFGVFAVATIVWGALTGSWFAIAPEHLPAALRGLPWLKVDDNVMWLCFLVGALHLTIANLWNAAVLWPSKKAFAQVGWALMNWTMFFAAAQLVTGRPFPSFALALGGVGFLLIVLFMLDKEEIKTEWINYPMLVLNLVSALVDVMSYIRLFAVGMASAKIALNFNQMATSFDLPLWLKPLPVLLILLFGHGLNLVLGALSVLVHAVRLNTLEFSNHIGLTWAGEPYRHFGGK